MARLPYLDTTASKLYEGEYEYEDNGHIEIMDATVPINFVGRGDGDEDRTFIL